MNQPSPTETTAAELRSTEPLPPEPMTAELKVQRIYERTYADFAGPLIGFAVVVVIICAYVFNMSAFFNRNSPPTSVEGLQQTATDSIQFASDAENVFAHVRWRELQDQLGQALSYAEINSRELEEVSNRLAEVMQSDIGRRIAADDELVDQFSELLNFPKPQPAELKAFQNDCADLIKVCERGANSKALMIAPSISQMDQVDALALRIFIAHDQLRVAEKALGALIRASRHNQMSSKTLAATMEQRSDIHSHNLLKKTPAERKLLSSERETQKVTQEVERELRIRMMEQLAKTEKRQQILKEARSKLAEDREKDNPNQKNNFGKPEPDYESY